MPCSSAKARILLKEKKAVVKRRTPFTIQLTIATGETTQPVTLGVDAGYKHVGLSASTKKAELYASEIELRQDVSELLAGRSALRHARRSRKTRHRAPRFDNRKRDKGWLAPSVENRIGAHVSRVEAVLRILPVTKIIVETASFDVQRLKNPDIQGVEYQQGEQLGFWNVREYVLFRDGHECQHCHGKSKDKVLNVHHIESRRTGGDAPNNLITLCETCHKAFHRGEIELRVKRGRSFQAETFMGVMRWTFFERLRARHSEIEVRNTFGYLTKNTRITHGIEKTHCADAFCIAGNLKAKRLGYYFFRNRPAATTDRSTSSRSSRGALANAIRRRTKSKDSVFTTRSCSRAKRPSSSAVVLRDTSTFERWTGSGFPPASATRNCVSWKNVAPI